MLRSLFQNQDDTAIAAYAHVYATMVSGATMLMPVETYGYNYFSINYTQTTSGSQLPAINPNTQNGPDWYSWFYVIASEDNTRLDITPSDTTKNGWLPNNTYTINLNKGESYHVFGKLIGSSSQAWAALSLVPMATVILLPFFLAQVAFVFVVAMAVSLFISKYFHRKHGEPVTLPIILLIIQTPIFLKQTEIITEFVYKILQQL